LKRIILSLWQVVVFVFVLIFVVLGIKTGKVLTRKDRKQRDTAKYRLRKAGHTSALHLVSRPGSFPSIALRGRPEVFDGSRRAAEIEHVGHGTAGVAGRRTRVEDTPSRYEAEKGTSCLCGQREMPSFFPAGCEVHDFTLYRRLRQEDPGWWLSKGKKQVGWMDGSSAGRQR
jgi:hypothetical protein